MLVAQSVSPHMSSIQAELDFFCSSRAYSETLARLLPVIKLIKVKDNARIQHQYSEDVTI
jgi:hypothetical protein